jgi:hypothetical protein
MVGPVRHRQTKEAETDMLVPKATAPHPDSTDLNLRDGPKLRTKLRARRRERFGRADCLAQSGYSVTPLLPQRWLYHDIYHQSLGYDRL